MLLTERYKDKIEGVLACYDRVVIHGNIPVLCFDGGIHIGIRVVFSG